MYSSSETRKFDFLIKFHLEGQDQLSPKTMGILTKLFSTSGPNLVILACMGNELWCGQAQNGVNYVSQVKFDLKGQVQLPRKSFGTLTKVFCIFSPNLAWMGPELSRGKASDWHTDWHTHTQTQAMAIPEGQNCPRVKNDSCRYFCVIFSTDDLLMVTINCMEINCNCILLGALFTMISTMTAPYWPYVSS